MFSPYTTQPNPNLLLLGIPFTAGDLARNLLLCPLVMAAQDSREQDRQYLQNWIQPVEDPAERLYTRARGSGSGSGSNDSEGSGLDALVTAFVRSTTMRQQAKWAATDSGSFIDSDDDSDGYGDCDGSRGTGRGIAAATRPTTDTRQVLPLSLTGNISSSSSSSSSSSRYVGSMEVGLVQMICSLPLNLRQRFGSKLHRDAPLGIYSRLHSYCEYTQLKLDRAMPSAVAGRGVGGGVEGSGDVPLSLPALAQVVLELRQFLLQAEEEAEKVAQQHK